MNNLQVIARDSQSTLEGLIESSRTSDERDVQLHRGDLSAKCSEIAGKLKTGLEWVVIYFICFFLSSSLSYWYPRLSTPWIGVLLDDGNCLLLK